jgi:hypothetical protein
MLDRVCLGDILTLGSLSVVRWFCRQSGQFRILEDTHSDAEGVPFWRAFVSGILGLRDPPSIRSWQLGRLVAGQQRQLSLGSSNEGLPLRVVFVHCFSPKEVQYAPF